MVLEVLQHFPSESVKKAKLSFNLEPKVQINTPDNVDLMEQMTLAFRSTFAALRAVTVT